MAFNIIAYHGTSKANAENIKLVGFEPSVGIEHWLGDGVYFFVEGYVCSTPLIKAIDWSKAEAWDNKSKTYRYKEGAAISVNIEVFSEKEFLDLTTKEGMDLFNYIRDQYVKKIEAADKKLKQKDRVNTFYRDGDIINEARRDLKLPLNVIKGAFFTPFKIERTLQIDCRVPNCIILVVNKIDIIKKETIKIQTFSVI